MWRNILRFSFNFNFYIMIKVWSLVCNDFVLTFFNYRFNSNWRDKQYTIFIARPNLHSLQVGTSKHYKVSLPNKFWDFFRLFVLDQFDLKYLTNIWAAFANRNSARSSSYRGRRLKVGAIFRDPSSTAQRNCLIRQREENRF